MPLISVITPTHNPHPARLHRTLRALRGQTLPVGEWETLLIDNASQPALTLAPWQQSGPANLRMIAEPSLGLSRARCRGFTASDGEILVMVDDDNVLDPDYLANVVRHFAADPGLGALGGNVRPDFEETPPAWVAQFQGLLALRELGPTSLRACWINDQPRTYPACSPIGAGLAIRRAVALDYAAALSGDAIRRQLDRTGDQLVSGGDNDLVMHVLEAGGSVGFEPDLNLTHLIPARRLERAYLGSLNRAIARSWVRVLALHGIQPWPPINPATVPLRQCRAWWRARAWRDPAAWIIWQGWCGQFEGQADLARAAEPPARPLATAKSA